MNARLGLRIATFAVALAVGLLILSFVFLSGYRGPQYTVSRRGTSLYCVAEPPREDMYISHRPQPVASVSELRRMVLSGGMPALPLDTLRYACRDAEGAKVEIVDVGMGMTPTLPASVEAKNVVLWSDRYTAELCDAAGTEIGTFECMTEERFSSDLRSALGSDATFADLVESYSSASDSSVRVLRSAGKTLLVVEGTDGDGAVIFGQQMGSFFKYTLNQSVSDGALRALGVVPCFLPQAALCFGAYALLCAWLVFGNDPVKRALFRLFSKKASDKALQA